MTELKEILYERNELKARVSDLEDELQMYRPEGSSNSGQYVLSSLDPSSLFYSACDLCTVIVLVQLCLAFARVLLSACCAQVIKCLNHHEDVL